MVWQPLLLVLAQLSEPGTGSILDRAAPAAHGAQDGEGKDRDLSPASSCRRHGSFQHQHLSWALESPPSCMEAPAPRTPGVTICRGHLEEVVKGK